jgi:hypothetical protein
VLLQNPAAAEYRIWEGSGGSSAEAEFVSVIGPNAMLRKRGGHIIKVPIARLSSADQNYVALAETPDLDPQVRVVKQKIIAPYNRSYGTREYFNCKCTIRKKSSAPYRGQVSAKLYLIGHHAFTGQLKVTRQEQLTVPELGRGNTEFELVSKPVEMLRRYNGPDMEPEFWKGRTPYEYEGYVLVVTDGRGKVIVQKESRSGLKADLDNQNKMLAGL